MGWRDRVLCRLVPSQRPETHREEPGSRGLILILTLYGLCDWGQFPSLTLQKQPITHVPHLTSTFNELSINVSSKEFKVVL